MAQIAYLIVLAFDHESQCWSYQTHDGIGTVVNFGSGYEDPGLAIKQAHIFTRTLLEERLCSTTVVIPYDGSTKQGVNDNGTETTRQREDGDGDEAGTQTASPE